MGQKNFDAFELPTRLTIPVTTCHAPHKRSFFLTSNIFDAILASKSQTTIHLLITSIKILAIYNTSGLKSRKSLAFGEESLLGI